MILALISALLLALPHEPEGEVRDSLKASEVTASLKFTGALFQQPVAVTEVSMRRLEQDRIRSVGDLSAVAPNFFQPRYGSHITSSLYFRGFGSRIDQPVVGVYLDDVPLLNKNAYDFDFLDLRRVQVLRGPQSVLFGRNTSLGVIRLESLSPFDWTGVKASAEAASNGSWKVSSSLFRRPSERLGWSLSAACTCWTVSQPGSPFRRRSSPRPYPGSCSRTGWTWTTTSRRPPSSASPRSSGSTV